MTVPRISAVVSGLAYTALGVVVLVWGSVPDQHWGTHGDVINLLGLLGFAANVVALEVLRAPLALGRVARVVLRIAELGLIAMSVESVASQLHGGNTLGPMFFLGLVLTLLGLLLVAIDGLRRPGARWLAPLPFLGLLVGIAGSEHGGFVVLGAVWLVLGGAAIGRPVAAASPTLAAHA